MRSINWCHFQWPWTNSNPVLKVRPFFDAKYITNGYRYDHSYYWRRIGNRTQAFEWHHFQWHWVTSKPDFKVMVLLLLSVFMLLTRDLFAIPKFLCSIQFLFWLNKCKLRCSACVGTVCPIGCGSFPNTGDTYCVPSEPCTPDASSIGVEWSGNVTAAGSTRRGYGLGSAVVFLYGIMTSKSWEVGRRLKTNGHPESGGCLGFQE